MLVKELWNERENNERLIIFNDLINDIDFTSVPQNIKDELTRMINGE